MWVPSFFKAFVSYPLFERFPKGTHSQGSLTASGQLKQLCPSPTLAQPDLRLMKSSENHFILGDYQGATHSLET